MYQIFVCGSIVYWSSLVCIVDTHIHLLGTMLVFCVGSFGAPVAHVSARVPTAPIHQSSLQNLADRHSSW